MIRNNFSFTKPDLSRLKDYFIQHGQLLNYRYKSHFIEHGSRPKYIGLVATGSFRSVLIDKKGREQFFDFASSGDFVQNYYSLRLNNRNKYDIRAYEDSTVYCLTYQELNHFFNTDNETEHLRILFLEELAFYWHKRLLFFYFNPNMEDRLLSLLSENPFLLSQYPKQEIASFIGCSPECFCRIRKSLQATAKI